MTGEYGIVANVLETDRVLRKGAKVWLKGGWRDGGFKRLNVRGLSRSGRPVEKWVPITRLDTFRAAWLPPEMREDHVIVSILGGKDDMTILASRLQHLAESERCAHPARREMAQ
jgi:hypothetical protein